MVQITICYNHDRVSKNVLVEIKNCETGKEGLMISELTIENYRGIRNLKLDNLGKINIIAGANNTGKTSILEVIRSLEAPNSIRNWVSIGRRGDVKFYMPPRYRLNSYDIMKSLFSVDNDLVGDSIKFYGLNNQETFCVEIKGSFSRTFVSKDKLDVFYSIAASVKDEDEEEEVDEYETDVLSLKFKVDGEESGITDLYSGQVRNMFKDVQDDNKAIVENVVYISPTQHSSMERYFNSLFKEPEMYVEFVEVMKLFDPGFVSVNAVTDELSHSRKHVVLSKNHKEGLLLDAYGDGMKKAMLLLSAVIKAKNGVLLLDEFETAIHVSAMKMVFGVILNTAMKYNVQIFMTSHSIEAIETVLKCYPEFQKDMRMITLVNVNDEVRVRNVSGEKAIQLLDEYGLELR